MKVILYSQTLKLLLACTFLGLFLSKIYNPWLYLPLLLVSMWIRYKEIGATSKRVRLQYLIFFLVVLGCISGIIFFPVLRRFL
jgi:hypothetical protein